MAFFELVCFLMFVVSNVHGSAPARAPRALVAAVAAAKPIVKLVHLQWKKVGAMAFF